MKQKLLTSALALCGIASLISFSAPVSAQSFIGGNAFSPFSEIAVAGTITLKSGNTLIVRNGGVDTRVIVNQDTRLIARNGLTISYTDLELGDRVQAFGVLVATRTLQADTIRNTVLPRGGYERVVTGTVAQKLGDRVTIRSGITDVDVFLNQDTLIVDMTGLRISLSGLEIGDRVAAYGELLNGDIYADTTVNLSVAYQMPSSYPAPLPIPAPIPSGTVTSAGTSMTLHGILTHQSGNQLTLSSGGKTYVIIVDATSKGTEKNGKAMSFAKMRNGDTLIVVGNQINATSLRGVTLQDVSVSWK